MKILVEFVPYFIIFVIICVISVEFIGVHYQISNANEFYDYLQDTIVINNYSTEVLDILKEEASQLGYLLEFEDHKEEYSSLQFCYLADLKYSVRIKLLGIVKEDTLSGYVYSIY